MSDWIKLKDNTTVDEIPKGEVLAIGYQSEMLIGYLDPDSCVCESEGMILEQVTHWMPLPEPPKKET